MRVLTLQAALLLLATFTVASEDHKLVARRLERRQSFITGLLNLFRPFAASGGLQVLQPIPKPPLNNNATYDYVVVGGGTSGSALAARLSENPTIKVALIEAGTDYNEDGWANQLVVLPGLDILGSGTAAKDYDYMADIDWKIQTVPMSGAAGRRTYYTRGKVLGGSSARNFLLYQRPNAEAQDTWVSLTGDSQWSWANTIDDYKRSVAFTPPNSTARKDNPAAQYDLSAYSNSGGPLQISYTKTPNKFSKYVQAALTQAGLPSIRDFNVGKLIGHQYPTTTINPKNGHRSTSRASFLEQARSRGNLHVFTAALAKKVIFDKTQKPARAVGVQFTKGNGTYQFSASKEVILSAGAFQTPQLLMVSGVGPRDQLTKNNIPIVYENSRVGQNMQDHVLFGPSYVVNNSLETFTKPATDLLWGSTQLNAFKNDQSGIYSNNVADFIAFFRSTDAELDRIGAGALKKLPSGWPTAEILSSPGYSGDFSSLIIDNSEKGRYGFLGGQLREFATILGALVAPQSRGTVTIASADTKDLPVVDMGWLTSPVDQAVAVDLFKRVRALFASSAMKPARTTNDEFYPGLQVSSDADILKWIQKNVQTVWHASASASAGKDPQTSVLDSNLRVWGVKGLRVVDASAFPSLLPGHPQSVCYMLAERAAKLLRAQNNHA